MQISGSSAVVVGGAGGLGEATVRRLHAAGAKVVIADLADEKGSALAKELHARYVRTDATKTEDVNAALAEAESLAPLRISVDAHGGPASGGRLVGKDGSPLDLDGFKTTIDVYLTGVFNVLRLAAAAIARQEPTEGRPRRHHQHRIDRSLRGSDRSAAVRGGQRRRGRHDAGRRP
jgi:NAD(P)-dependent dehydrogenase (short-subunit alcohol dehydrogenase family)